MPPGEAPVWIWSLPGEALSTQSLFRLSIVFGGEIADLRLALYLQDPATFQVAVSDALGRGLWRLEVGGGEMLLLDHRSRTYCEARIDASEPQSGMAGAFLEGLPRLLVGRVPASPQSVAQSADGRLRLRGTGGRRWLVRVVGERVESWSLRRRGRTMMGWLRRPGGGELNLPRRGRVRWRLMVEEPLREALESPAPDEGYRSVRCDAKKISELWQGQPPSGGAGSP